ncbi:hypothetical protein ABW20_dc0105633 [Dactylellina cionopaga]|nr:hypothetical protein ABW20_dc0105633 [Dactylellina cionopaga]
MPIAKARPLPLASSPPTLRHRPTLSGRMLGLLSIPPPPPLSNDSRYSGSSLAISQADSPLQDPPLIHSVRRPISALHPQDIISPIEWDGANPVLNSNRNESTLSVENFEDNARCLSRLSRLSYISNGAAFVVSEESESSQRSSGLFYRVESIMPGLRDLPDATPSNNRTSKHVSTRNDNHLAGTLGNIKDSAVRIHPADSRFEQRATDAEEPIYVPVYTFEPPGKFPDRSRLTAPKAAPRFVNHTPRNFSLPGRAVGDIGPRSSSESNEMLLGDAGKFDGGNADTSVPPRAYGAQGRFTRSIGIFPDRRPSFTIPSLPKRNKRKTDPFDDSIHRIESHFKKETARQKFEKEHSHYFHDLDHLAKAQWPDTPGYPQIQIHGPRHSFSSKYGFPTLNRPEDAYVGDNINKDRWPERYKRQKRIGRSLLCVCLLMPPFWLVMAVGLLDNLVVEVTAGEIWSVGEPEKAAAAWLGGLSCFALIVFVIAIGIVVL